MKKETPFWNGVYKYKEQTFRCRIKDKPRAFKNVIMEIMINSQFLAMIKRKREYELNSINSVGIINTANIRKLEDNGNLFFILFFDEV
jgi:hypothetical protein